MAIARKALAAILGGAGAYYAGHKMGTALDRKREKRFQLRQDTQGRVNRAYELALPVSQVRDFGRVVGPDKRINYLRRAGLSGQERRHSRSLRMQWRWPGVDFKNKAGLTLKQYLKRRKVK